ncbi:MAG: hypothetical protein SOT91_05855 [Bacilli bacterium]|nr:hypothetical protein [Clostridium sp.]MDY2804866.1 hypothetical protein [Bacilli bacterium]
MKRLNIFVDETGEFGFGNGASELYGVSFTFHEQNNDIMLELNKLNDRLYNIGYTDMLHIADLIMKRGDYSKFPIAKRKSIFNSIYQFSRRIPVKYKTIIIDKKYTDNSRVLKQKLSLEINNMVKEHERYFNKFDMIIMYYDNGQEVLGTILDAIFSRYKGFEHRVEFDHKEKRLFQVSDMLTYIDKYNYKYKNKMSFTKSEQYFFNLDEIRKILKELNKKRF